MHVTLDPSSRAPNQGPRFPLSVGPVYEREGRRVVRAGVLAIADALVAQRPFWEPLEELAVHAEGLRATCYGVARGDGGSPVAGFCGTWQSTPRPTLIVAGKHIASEKTIELDPTACYSTAFVRREDEPFPHWQPGDPWLPVFWERAC